MDEEGASDDGGLFRVRFVDALKELAVKRCERQAIPEQPAKTAIFDRHQSAKGSWTWRHSFGMQPWVNRWASLAAIDHYNQGPWQWPILWVAAMMHTR
jgi:hypothetical protein